MFIELYQMNNPNILNKLEYTPNPGVFCLNLYFKVFNLTYDKELFAVVLIDEKTVPIMN